MLVFAKVAGDGENEAGGLGRLREHDERDKFQNASLSHKVKACSRKPNTLILVIIVHQQTDDSAKSDNAFDRQPGEPHSRTPT